MEIIGKAGCEGGEEVNNRMLKKIFQIIFNSIVLFSVVSFFSVLFALISRNGNDNPSINIGFPLKYYEQFGLKNNNLHWGWSGKNFTINYSISIIVILLIFIVKNKNNPIKRS